MPGGLGFALSDPRRLGSAAWWQVVWRCIGAMPERREIHEYTPRLMRAIGYPRMVLPTHWDRFNVTYDVSQQPARERLQSFIAEVKAASPKTEVLVPAYFEPITLR